MRCRMSARISLMPNTASSRSIEPAFLASRVWMSSFMLPSLRRLRLAQAGRLRRVLRQRRLGRVAHLDPTAFSARHRAADKQKSALGIDADDLQILSGDALVAQMAGHLLAFEDLAGVLALAGRTVRTVRNGDAVRGAQAAEIPALHGAGETFADADAGNIDLLADNKMVGAQLGADR